MRDRVVTVLLELGVGNLAVLALDVLLRVVA
jgi:hypothetical protein